MGKNYFTQEQVEILKKNKYVNNVSEKAIAYTENFKEVFNLEYNNGKLPSQILLEMGFDIKALGHSRISNISRKVRSQAVSPTGFKDTRSGNSGRRVTKELSQKELIKRQQNQIEYLKQQVEFLSDLRRLEREAMSKASKSKKKQSSK